MRSGLVKVTLCRWIVGAPDVSRGVLRARQLRDDGSVIAAIEGYVHDNPRHGFDKLYPAL